MGCAGCFNPGTHALAAKTTVVENLVAEMLSADPLTEGLTITGGEPLEQAEATSDLVSVWKKQTQSTVVLLTGFTWSEIQRDNKRLSAVADVDVVIAGRYNRYLHLASGLRGSANKEYYFLTEIYSVKDFHELPEIEIILLPNQTMIQTGMHQYRSLGQ